MIFILISYLLQFDAVFTAFYGNWLNRINKHYFYKGSCLDKYILNKKNMIQPMSICYWFSVKDESGIKKCSSKLLPEMLVNEILCSNDLMTGVLEKFAGIINIWFVTFLYCAPSKYCLNNIHNVLGINLFYIYVQ